MGADLIGFFVKGPQKFTDEQIAAAEVAAADVANTLRAAHEEFARSNMFVEGGDEFGAGPVVEALPAWAKEIVENSGEAPEDWKDSSSKDVVRDFVEFWYEQNFRDVASRTDPDDENQILLFTGEPSWGEEPQGGGYLAVREADRFGLFEPLGIR